MVRGCLHLFRDFMYQIFNKFIVLTKSSNKIEEKKLLNASVFSLKRVIKNMGRQIFVFLGLISHSNIGNIKILYRR